MKNQTSCSEKVKTLVGILKLDEIISFSNKTSEGNRTQLLSSFSSSGAQETTEVFRVQLPSNRFLSETEEVHTIR